MSCRSYYHICLCRDLFRMVQNCTGRAVRDGNVDIVSTLLLSFTDIQRLTITKSKMTVNQGNKLHTRTLCPCSICVLSMSCPNILSRTLKYRKRTCPRTLCSVVEPILLTWRGGTWRRWLPLGWLLRPPLSWIEAIPVYQEDGTSSR